MHLLSPYINKIERQEQFCSLLYGDGEFRVMMGQEPSGLPFTHYQEIVTPLLRRELENSLNLKQPGIIRATDLNLINWRTYQGSDFMSFAPVGQAIERYLQGRKFDWIDGTVWETAVATGQLGPFLKALKGVSSIALVANERICGLEWWSNYESVQRFVIPKSNAYRAIAELETELREVPSNAIHIYCMGLGTIPLICRMRKIFPNTTMLDLGSTFDVFAGIGSERGWRGELYQDKEKHAVLIEANLKGVFD